MEAQPARRTVIDRLLGALQQGERLSTALGQQPRVFPPLLVGVVQAAEGMSDLPHALTRYIGYETRLDGIRERVVSASIYPAILLAVGGAVTFFLLGYVVPRFAAIYDGGGKALPWASQLLMAWGRFIGAHAQVVLLFLAGSLAMAILWARRYYARDGWSKALGLLPGVKARIDVLEVSRLYLTLGMLLRPPRRTPCRDRRRYRRRRGSEHRAASPRHPR